MRIPIHTTISNEEYNRILEFGKGRLNKGISALISIADSKEIIINVTTTIIMNNNEV